MAKLLSRANRLLIRIRVKFFDTFTKIEAIGPDPTTDASRRSLTMLATKTISCATPKSLMVLMPVFIGTSTLFHMSLGIENPVYALLTRTTLPA